VPTCSCAQRLTAIRGKSRNGDGRIRHGPGCAQRLTAIRGKSHCASKATAHLNGCAQRLTAIRGKSRANPHPKLGALIVLNALRQSEENHLEAVRTVTPAPVSAQRLTAIRGKSHSTKSTLAPKL